MTYPTCDNECTMLGWHEYLLEGPQGIELHVSVASETDLDDRFLAFCHDEQEMIQVSGWLFEKTKRLS